MNGNNLIEEATRERISLGNKAFYSNQDLFNLLAPEFFFNFSTPVYKM